MNEDFVTYELAIKLKEKGFREECLCHYVGEDLVYNIESSIANYQLWFSHNKFDNIWHRDNYDAPTISQVLKWLRDVKKIYVAILPLTTHTTINKVVFYYLIEYNSTGETMTSIEPNNYCVEWKDAAVAGISYVLDNLI